METKATYKYLRMSPRKVRLVAKEIKKNNVEDAITKLKFIRKTAAKPITKVLKSAIANATKNFGVDSNNLYIKDIIVSQGPILKYAKRFMPRAMGRASAIHKRSSHVTVILTDKKD